MKSPNLLISWIFSFVVFAGTSFSVLSKEAAIIDLKSRFHSVYGSSGMVVSQEILASTVGAEILSQGGNAIDAAVATGFALAVTLPRAGNLAGGGFMMVYLADKEKTIALDYREMAPSGATRDMFLDAQGDVDNQLARFSGAWYRCWAPPRP
jgi:gamma-glutamyltranspeptidase/glutathione hydrolase